MFRSSYLWCSFWKFHLNIAALFCSLLSKFHLLAVKNVSFSFFIFNGNRKQPKQGMSLLFFSPQNSNVFLYLSSSFSMVFCRHTVIEVNERSHGQWLYYGLCVNVFFFLYILIFNVTFLFSLKIIHFKEFKNCKNLTLEMWWFGWEGTNNGGWWPEDFGFQSFACTSWYWDL